MPQIEHSHPENKGNYQQKDNSGAIFIAREKKSDRHPDMTGECMVNGKMMRVAAWNKTSKGGTQYLSLSFSEPMEKREGKQTTAEPTVSALLAELGAITGEKKASAQPAKVFGKDDDIPF